MPYASPEQPCATRSETRASDTSRLASSTTPIPSLTDAQGTGPVTSSPDRWTFAWFPTRTMAARGVSLFTCTPYGASVAGALITVAVAPAPCRSRSLSMTTCSVNVPAPTLTVSPGAAASTAAWIVAKSRGTAITRWVAAWAGPAGPAMTANVPRTADAVAVTARD